MPYDFSKEDNQTTGNQVYGPVPSGSIVCLKIEVTESSYSDPADPCITVARSGLKQINCKFTIVRGTYDGVSFFQSITLPVSMQNIDLTAGQLKGCQIGGAQIKAICQSANKPMQIASFASMNGWVFPARVRLNKSRPFVTRNGNIIWHNELDRIITPEMPEYQKMRSAPFEIINEGGATQIELAPDEQDALLAKAGFFPPDNSRNGYQGHDDNPFGDNRQPQLDDLPF